MPARTRGSAPPTEGVLAQSAAPRVNMGWVAGAMIAVAVALAAGVFIGIASDGSDDTEAGTASVEQDSVDVGFSRDMRDHHAQAVEMSVMVREATDDAEVRTLALDILLTQQHQLGQMFGWLAAWGYPQVGSGEPMTWMGVGEMAGMEHDSTPDSGGSIGESAGVTRMPGMATEKQLRALEEAEGRRAERIYLQLMIPHHEAGVEMAEFAAVYATQPQVAGLAQSIVDSQTAELEVLQSMLEARGGPVGNL